MTATLIVIYLRVSTEEQAKKGFSLPEQRDACRQKAAEITSEIEAAGGRAEIREFVDTFGGDVLERPVLEEMRGFIRAQAPAWFICMDPDRFSRSLKWQLVVADEIEGVGTKLTFVQQEYDPTDPMSKAFFQFRGLMSEVEKAKILERTSRGKRGKLKAGKRSNGVSPFGYQHNAETDELEILEQEAQWVRQMFRWVIDDQLSFYQVAHKLDRLGVPTKKGGRWRGETVADILRNTAYVGHQVFNRYDASGQSARRRLPREKRNALTHKVRPQSEWIIITVPAIIDQATFDLAQQRLATNVRRGGPRDKHLLSMLAKCGLCGTPMSYIKGKHYRYLRCNRRYAVAAFRADRISCPMRHQRVDHIEAEIWQTVCSWLTEPALMEQYLQEQQRSDPPAMEGIDHLAAEITALERELADAQDSQAIIIQKQQKKLLTEAAADRLLAQSTSRMAALEAQLSDTRHRYRQLEDHLASARGMAKRIQNIAEAVSRTQGATRSELERLDSDQRRKLIRQVISTVIVHQDGTWTIVPVG